MDMESIGKKMFVIVTYDIDIESGAKRLRKVSKVCECYGYRVQKSVFEMNIDSAQLTHLINELKTIVNSEKDSIRIYKCGKTMKGKTVILGKRQKIEVADDSAFFL
ncbi:MAG: CRISPR-associated endonuclease Cas2 [Eubacterium sp.]|nr:CRISPR-associated endonuclease Cas2 [Eubacterium sp.]